MWAEGTAGVALAQQRLGAAAATTTLSNLAALQHSDGSLPYATVADDPTSMTTQSSVSATSWFVIASLGPNSIW